MGTNFVQTEMDISIFPQLYMKLNVSYRGLGGYIGIPAVCILGCCIKPCCCLGGEQSFQPFLIDIGPSGIGVETHTMLSISFGDKK